jgi:hypothetical protein
MALTYAQAPIAMLQHGTNLTPFYGNDALINAYNAAQDEDIITLSPGIFNACNINKGITVRGAGMMSDTATGTTRTLISGDFVIEIFDSTKSVAFEGLYFNGTVFMDTAWNPQFSKCYINSLADITFSNSRIYNCNIVHCIIPAIDADKFQNAHFYNSVVCDPNYYTTFADGECVFDHCIIKFNCYNYWGSSAIDKIYSTNSILMPRDTSKTTDPENTCIHHEYGIGITHPAHSFFHPAGSAEANHLYNFSDFSQVFVGFDFDITIYADYHLLPSVAATYLGSDSTQIGIYGGTIPFDPRILNPSIGHITVGGQTNDQGQLPVTIEVINE